MRCRQLKPHKHDERYGVLIGHSDVMFLLALSACAHGRSHARRVGCTSEVSFIAVTLIHSIIKAVQKRVLILIPLSTLNSEEATLKRQVWKRGKEDVYSVA